ncbi:MAG: metal-dependent hydrolase [Thiotrichaceae bacterium]|nr:metal-dependent hydrolase [Thiotrichaceae bacterium]
MANFNTHISYAAGASGLNAILFLQVGFISQTEALAMALTGTLGGILPDIDLKRSYPSQLLFALVGFIAAFTVVFLYENKMSVIELWGMGVLTFLVIRYPVSAIFHRYTTHRGAMHSILIALLCSFLVVILMFNLFDKTRLIAWFFGFFMFFGFIVHLLLDELYSVDFDNRRIKRSFGTAFKLIDRRNPIQAGAMLGLTLFVWYLAPSAREFWDIISSGATYHIIGNQLFPEYLTRWF